MRPSAGAVLGLLLVAVAPASGDEARDLLRTLQEQLADGRREAALATARRYVAIAPGNPAVWYNLAGLEEWTGRRPAAVAAFRRAVSLGFDDFRHADEDRDLGDLRGDPAYAELRRAWLAGLATRARERALALVAGEWSESRELVDRRGGLDPPRATARLRATADNLEVELILDGAEISPDPPWQGGSGVVAAVVLPEAAGAADGRHHAEFGFGLADGVPAGAVRLGPRWQRLAELTPKLRREPATGRTRVTFAIPWVVCRSLHPLVDDVLDLNLIYVRRDGDGAAAAAWLGDPAAGRFDRPWRRGIPCRVQWPAAAGPAVHGRLADLVVRGDGLDLRPLAAVARDDRPAEVRLVVRDHAGGVAVQTAWTLTGRAGRRQRDGVLAARLDPGSARLGATLTASGADLPATWETNLVVLPPGWEQATSSRIGRAPAREQPALRLRLDAVETALAARHPLDDPAALGSTVDELETLLDRIAATGTSVPAGGTYLALVPGGGGRPDLPCSLALPAGWRRGAAVPVLLLLAGANGGEQRAVNLAPRLLAERSADRQGGTAPLALVVPHLPADLEPDAAAATAARLVDWTRNFLACGPVHLCGVDRFAAAALELAATRRADLAGLLLITGMDFAPYPDPSDAGLGGQVSGLDPGLRAGWIWFPDEQRRGDQSEGLRRALERRGLRLEPAQAVPGGLDYNQAWTRAVLWAAGLAVEPAATAGRPSP
ncbi:MAG TPA: hypothetical protein PLL30_11035 [Candidatus Krumholzibacteria bacterium]|nr:hypothetical protein [Candidatus Krumholzibacteria bacterium]HPD72299.1 hypothetical protein [Candidatus Krumholzibacteria bacterium]HRY40769.1 hypothetical protein [Candidatus Krumholzibacteria bacterium]